MGIAKKPAAPAAKPAAVAAKPAAAKATPAASAAIVGASASLKEAKLTVSTTVLANGTIQGEPVEQSEIEIRSFATTPAMAVSGLKLKKNLGNYESVEFFVSQSVPCYVEELDSVQSQVNENVKRILDETFAAFDPSAYGVTGEAENGLGVDTTEGTAEEDASGEGEAEAEGEGEVTPEYIETASREELEALMEGSPDAFSFTADEYPDDDDLRSMMTAELFPDGVEGEGEDGDVAAEGDSEEATVYTQEDLEAASMDELKQFYDAWELGEFPAFNAKNEKIVKKKAIKTILDAQEAASG